MTIDGQDDTAPGLRRLSPPGTRTDHHNLSQNFSPKTSITHLIFGDFIGLKRDIKDLPGSSDFQSSRSGLEPIVISTSFQVLTGRPFIFREFHHQSSSRLFQPVNRVNIANNRRLIQIFRYSHASHINNGHQYNEAGLMSC